MGRAAWAAGCRRVVFASSLYAVLGYPPATYIHSDLPPRPVTLYGASKAWGESLFREYARVAGVSMLCVRIGFLAPTDAVQITPDHPHLALVVTPSDLVDILAACIDAPDSVRFGIFHAVSHRHSRRFDMRAAERVLGFVPRDDIPTLAWHNYRGTLRRIAAACRRYTRKLRTTHHRYCG